MKKLFEEPMIECVKIVSEVITEDGGKVPGADMGLSANPFPHN